MSKHIDIYGQPDGADTGLKAGTIGLADDDQNESLDELDPEQVERLLRDNLDDLDAVIHEVVKEREQELIEERAEEIKELAREKLEAEIEEEWEREMEQLEQQTEKFIIEIGPAG